MLKSLSLIHGSNTVWMFEEGNGMSKQEKECPFEIEGKDPKLCTGYGIQPNCKFNLGLLAWINTRKTNKEN